MQSMVEGARDCAHPPTPSTTLRAVPLPASGEDLGVRPFPNLRHHRQPCPQRAQSLLSIISLDIYHALIGT